MPTVITHLYVSPAGNDAGAGTAGAPFRTIQAAAEAATPGTIVHVAPGTYAETIASRTSGTAEAPIRFVSDVPGAAVIRPVGATSSVWESYGSHVTVEGFDIDGSNSPGVRIGLYLAGAHTTAQGNKVRRATSEGAESQPSRTGKKHPERLKDDDPISYCQASVISASCFDHHSV